MRSASSSGEGDSDRVSHPKRIDASEENCGNLSRSAQQIADRGRHREQRGVLTDKTGNLQPDRGGSRRGEDNRCIVARRKASMGLAVALPDRDRGAIVAKVMASAIARR